MRVDIGILDIGYWILDIGYFKDLLSTPYSLNTDHSPIPSS
jgi:hypothetical protein